jgi:parallel beta-helix repeat protein
MSNNTLGLSIVGGIGCRITGNQVTNNTKGIMFFGSGNIFRSNQLANNNINFDDLAGEKSDVDTSNTVDGKPICYLVDQKNMTVPADAGLVHLEGCQNIIIQGLDIQHASKAIALFNSSSCRISQNKLADGETGISLHDSPNNSITQNEVINNSDDGIEQFDSENTTITHNLIRGNGGGVDSGGYTAIGSRNANISRNQITGNSGCGIQAGTACSISGNYIEGNGQHGIYFFDISNAAVYRNTIKQNGDCGVSFRTGKNASITGNDISKNNVGIWMGDAMGDLSWCAMTENNFAQNKISQSE